MKKVLFGTTTLVAAGLISGTAFAGNVTSKDNLELSIGGKMEQYFGGVGAFEKGGREDGFGINTDTELYFTGKTTLDNGITVKAVIQLEAATSDTTNADEQYVELSGSFGKIQAGQKEDAASQLAVVAPTVGYVSVNDTYKWLGTPTNGTFAGGDTTWSSDDATVSYFTPSFYGFTGAVSYTPNPGSALVPSGKSNRDTIYMTVGYSNEFSGVGIDADVGGLVNTSVDESWGVRSGLNLSYAGFTVGGSFMTFQGDNAANKDTWVWDGGVSYEVGPYAVGFTYGANNGGGSVTGEQQSYNVQGRYNMGPGVNLVGNVFYAADDAVGPNSDRDGVGAVAGVILAF